MRVNDEIISLDDFRKKINRYQQCYDEIYFRGEVRTYPSREPSILRVEGYFENEGNMYHDMMYMYNEQMNNAYKYIGKLALLQHNNVPTRLLDITSNPFVALYFSCEQNGTADSEDGYIFMYIRKGKYCHSPEVYILSLHACFPKLSYREIIDRVQQEYNLSYTEEQIRSIVHTPIFLKSSDELNIGNTRIKAQDGCFFICADNENGGLTTLDSIPPVHVFRIPAVYKEAIRGELEQEGINVCSIYPEMLSGGTYLKEKYKKDVYQVSEQDYEIYDVLQEKSSRRDTNLYIIIRKRMSINHIKKVVRYVSERYKNTSDVIWIYVGLSIEDILSYNWRIRGRWINPLWENTGINTLTERDGEFSWENGYGTTIISDFNEKNVFKSDKEVYVYYHRIFAESLLDIQKLILSYNNNQWKKVYRWLSRNEKYVRELLNKILDGYRSRSPRWNELIKQYIYLYTDLDNACLETIMEDLESQTKWKLIGRRIEHMKNEIKEIQEGEVEWRATLELTDEELEKLNLNQKNQHTDFFEQTIPINDAATEVVMEIMCEKTEEGKIIVSGRTNLFDGAELMVTIIPPGAWHGPSCKVTCMDNHFKSEPLGNGKNLYGECVVKVILSISSTQPIEFVKKSGMQYENLKGNFIKRDGIAPSGEYKEKVIL